MSQTEKPSESSAPSDEPTTEAQITDYDALRADQVDVSEWRVLNLSGDLNTAYEVDTAALTCSCADHEFNQQTAEQVCKHLAFVLAGNGRTMADKQPLSIHIDAGNVGEAVASSSAEESDTDAATAAEADQEGDVNTNVKPDNVQAPLLDRFESHVEKAADFVGFDASIIDLDWASAEGREGIAIDRQPFVGGYYADDEWQDKEAYDEHRDKAGEWLSNADEAQWYGEPDYVYFVAADDVPSMVGETDDE